LRWQILTVEKKLQAEITRRMPLLE